MGHEKFVIPPKKFTGETSVVSARLPNNMINALDCIAKKTGRNRNEIVMMCLEYAITHLEVQNDD